MTQPLLERTEKYELALQDTYAIDWWITDVLMPRYPKHTFLYNSITTELMVDGHSEGRMSHPNLNSMGYMHYFRHIMDVFDRRGYDK